MNACIHMFKVGILKIKMKLEYRARTERSFTLHSWLSRIDTFLHQSVMCHHFGFVNLFPVAFFSSCFPLLIFIEKRNSFCMKFLLLFRKMAAERYLKPREAFKEGVLNKTQIFVYKT